MLKLNLAFYILFSFRFAVFFFFSFEWRKKRLHICVYSERHKPIDFWRNKKKRYEECSLTFAQTDKKSSFASFFYWKSGNGNVRGVGYFSLLVCSHRVQVFFIRFCHGVCYLLCTKLCNCHHFLKIMIAFGSIRACCTRFSARMTV